MKLLLDIFERNKADFAAIAEQLWRKKPTHLPAASRIAAKKIHKNKIK